MPHIRRFNPRRLSLRFHSKGSKLRVIQAVYIFQSTHNKLLTVGTLFRVDWKIEEGGLRCTVSVRTHWATGVEMEALCGVSAGLLCAWDMLKPIEKDSRGQYPDVRSQDIRVVRKKKADPQY